MSERPEIKINEWLVEGVELYKNHMGFLTLVALIVIVFSIVSIGILAGPLTAGLIFIILDFYDGNKENPPLGAVFRGFSKFGPTLVYSVFWGVVIAAGSYLLRQVPFLGQLLSLAYFLLLGSLLIFGLFLVADRGESFWAASMASAAKVRSGSWAFVGFGAMTLVIGTIGVFLCGFGAIFSLPIMICILAVSYREVFTGVATERAVLVSEQSEVDLSKIFKNPEEIEPRVWEVSEDEMTETHEDEPLVPPKKLDGTDD